MAAVVVGAVVAATPAEGPIDRLEALSRAIRSRPTWRAPYHQEYVAGGMTAGEEVDGTVWLAWPDRAHFRAGDPPVRLMGLEGRQVRLLDLEVGSCDDHAIDDDEWSRIPLAALLDPRQAVDRFTILDHGANGLALVPREPGGVARVEVVLGEDRLPREVVVVDPQGATNRLTFGGWRATKQPPDGRWLPSPPAGMECVADEQ